MLLYRALRDGHCGICSVSLTAHFQMAGVLSCGGFGSFNLWRS
jgi:hypothetical protein